MSMSSTKQKQMWVDDRTWGCMKHIPMAIIPAKVERCWFCSAERPPLPLDASSLSCKKTPLRLIPGGGLGKPSSPSERPPLKEVSFNFAKILKAQTKCAWRDCQKMAVENSKYCSRGCSNKNAHDRAKARRKKS